MYYNAASNSMWIYLIRKVPESVRLNWELQEDPKSVFVYGKDEQPRCTVTVNRTGVSSSFSQTGTEKNEFKQSILTHNRLTVFC